MKKLLIIFSTVLLLVLSGCGNEKEIRNDVENTLNEIIAPSGNNDIYIYQADISQVDTNSDTTLAHIRSRVTYEIRDISNDKVSILFTTPDTMAILNDAVENGATDIDELLKSVESSLQENFQTCEYEVELGLKELNAHWYIVPNTQLENALSGGLLDAYSQIIMEYVDGTEEIVE